MGRISSSSLNCEPTFGLEAVPTSLASHTISAPTVSLQIGSALVSPPVIMNLSVPLFGQRFEWMKRSSWLVPTASTFGVSTEAPSSGRIDMRTIGWQEPSTMPSATSRTWWQFVSNSGRPGAIVMPSSQSPMRCAFSRLKLSTTEPSEPIIHLQSYTHAWVWSPAPITLVRSWMLAGLDTS